MHSRINLKKILTDSCIIYTLLITLVYFLGAFISATWIPTVKMVISLLFFSVILSLGNEFLKSNILVYPIRLFIHFIATSLIFYIVFIVWGGLLQNGGKFLITFFLYTLVYVIVTVISRLISYIRSEKSTANKTYDSLYSKKK